MSDSNIQLGKLTSNVTVMDEDELLSPAQLDKIAELVMQKMAQKQQKIQRRQADQAISKRGGAKR